VVYIQPLWWRNWPTD